jgi:hypothetical protein
MEPKAVRELIHCVNNLLAVIQTQHEVARAVRTHEAATSALETIGRSAQSTQKRMKELRARDIREA